MDVTCDKSIWQCEYSNHRNGMCGYNHNGECNLKLETKHYVDDEICCACEHFHWGMGEMGTCDLKVYKSFNDIGEWSDKCDIGKFKEKSA